MKEIPNITGIRFFLALLVIVFHFNQFSINQGLGGYVDIPILERGVEAVFLFFVLSGFLIVRILYKATIVSGFSILNFYKRRALRILPLYYIVVIVGFVMYWLVFPKLNLSGNTTYNIWEGLGLIFFFLPNVFSTYNPGGILEILWSIGIEEQFYLWIAPLLLFMPKKLRFISLLLLFIVLLWLTFNVVPFLLEGSFFYHFLLAGGITGIAAAQKQIPEIFKSSWISVTVWLMVLMYFTTNWFSFRVPVYNHLFTAVVFSLFVYGLSIQKPWQLLNNRVCNYLGKISYGIYMYHVPVIYVVSFGLLHLKKNGYVSNGTMLFVAGLLTIIMLTIGVAHFSYNYIERYFLKQKEKYPYN